jgi:hypothetical protein
MPGRRLPSGTTASDNSRPAHVPAGQQFGCPAAPVAEQSGACYAETAEGGWGMSGRAFSGEDFDALDAGAAGH